MSNKLTRMVLYMLLTTIVIANTGVLAYALPDNEVTTAKNYPEPIEESLAAAQITEEYAEIYNTTSQEGEILGKLYNGSVATILAQEGD